MIHPSPHFDHTDASERLIPESGYVDVSGETAETTGQEYEPLHKCCSREMGSCARQKAGTGPTAGRSPSTHLIDVLGLAVIIIIFFKLGRSPVTS